VPFDEFFAGQVAHLPLSLEIPAQYVFAKGLRVPFSYTYWMQQSEIAVAAKSQDLPTKTGYIYGKISLDVGYDRLSDRFTGEDGMQTKLNQSGLDLLEMKRVTVGIYPILSVVSRARSTGNIVCAMYVGTLIDTNVLYIAYRPPENNLTRGSEIWRHILESMTFG
jgi:hypothetical protein